MEYSALAKLPALEIAITTANRHQAVTSSLAAEAIVSVPKGVLVIFRS